MKKVIHVLHELLPSGAETMLASSAPLWEGYKGYILATAECEGTYADTLRKSGYEVVHIHHDNPIIQHRAVRRYLKKESFDVCHIHVEGQSVFYSADAKLAGIPKLVLTVHSTFIFHGVLRVRRIITRWISRRLGGMFIAISDGVAENETTRFHNECYRSIYNWCDTDKYYYVSEQERREARLEKRVNENTFVVTMVGNCAPVKNHAMMLRAFGQFLKETNANAVLWHIGHGALEDEERKLVEEYGDKIIFWGRQNPKAFFAASDMYYMCSRIEGLSISALEAMSCGLPTVFTDTAGLREFKKIRSDEIVYTDFGEENMARAINTVYQRFLKGQHHSMKLAERVMDIYNAENSVRAYLEVYNSD